MTNGYRDTRVCVCMGQGGGGGGGAWRRGEGLGRKTEESERVAGGRREEAHVRLNL